MLLFTVDKHRDLYMLTGMTDIKEEPLPSGYVCGAVVHEGWLHGREDQADRAQVVQGRAAARPHHGLLRHGREAKGVWVMHLCVSPH